MPPWFIKLFMFLMASGAALVAIDQVRKGVVTWRGGAEAATREKNPVSFWAVIAFEVFVSVILFSRSVA